MNDNETKEEQGKRLSDWIVSLEDALRKTQKSRDKWKTQCLAETEACAKFWVGTLISEVGCRMSIDDIDAYVNHRLNESVRSGEVAVYYNAMVSEDVREEFKLEREREASNE
jgi:hypothetical protein